MGYVKKEKLMMYLADMRLTAAPYERTATEDWPMFLARYGGIKDAMDALENWPEEDVVPVVRCKDCAEWQREWEPQNVKAGEHFCAYVGLVTAPDWYCADGNREGG